MSAAPAAINKLFTHSLCLTHHTHLPLHGMHSALPRHPPKGVLRGALVFGRFGG
jgi:hypothetical protein